MKKPHRMSAFKPTTDDWYPSYRLDGWWQGKEHQTLVEVSCLELLGPEGDWRVCVWGGDDFGMELDFSGDDAQSKSTLLFLDLIAQDTITRQDLIDRGFARA